MTRERERQIRDLLRGTESRLEGKDTASQRYHLDYLHAHAIRDLLADKAELEERISELTQYSNTLRQLAPDGPDLGGPDD